MNTLQRMIVIPPEIFEKFKHIVLEDAQLSSLDKNMKSILRNKKLSDLSKWHLYRQNLLNYSSIKRKNAHRNNFKGPIKHVEGVGVQTKRIFTRDKDTETYKPELFDSSSQTINIPIIPEFKGVGDLPVSQQGTAENYYGDGEDDEVFTEDEYDQREVVNTRNSRDFKTVELKNGDVLTVAKFQKPEKPVKKHKTSIRKAGDGYLQTELGFVQRKSTRPATVEKITRSQSLRLNPSQDWTKI